MKENVNTEELDEAARETGRQLQDVLERKIDEVEEVKRQLRVVEATQGLLDEIDQLNDVNNSQPKVYRKQTIIFRNLAILQPCNLA